MAPNSLLNMGSFVAFVNLQCAKPTRQAQTSPATTNRLEGSLWFHPVSLSQLKALADMTMMYKLHQEC